MWRRKKEKEQDVAAFPAQPLTAERNHLTPKDVQEKVFRLSFRGYNEQDVDRFLDDVTEEIAALHEENKRLRESLEERVGGSSSDLLREAERRAGETVRQAREYAARLMEDAGKRAAREGTASSPASPPSSFLMRERDFLQRIATLVQEHAEALKAEARRSRTPKPAPAPLATPPPPPVGEEPAAAAPSPEMAERGRPTEATEAHEPFLEDWEETFSGGSEEQPFAGSASDLFPEERKAQSGERTGERTKEREEPSLRELFWGEE